VTDFGGLVTGRIRLPATVIIFTKINCMKRTLLQLLLLIGLNAYAQQAPIAIVSPNGTTQLTSTLDSAALLAHDNDIIYLPGGVLAGQTVMHFDKKVTVIGVGHHPDSTSATGRTEIVGNIGFQATGSILDGVYVSGSVYVSANCKVYRTNTGEILCPGGWITATNIVVDQCVMRQGVYGQYALNNIMNSDISNSIIAGNFTQQHYNNTFSNCIFLATGQYGIEQASQCIYRNCTFTGITSWGNPSNSFYYNNVFTSAGYPPLTDSSNAINNIINQTGASIFTTPPAVTYSYANDYTLKPGSLAIGAGTGGTDIGIYGGTTLWTAGNIPPNPNIRMKNVDAQTQANGTLRVRFDVRGQ
jgi:hypothetical protein